jgi:hypothetical protein
MSREPAEPFSWRATLAGLRAPGPPPRGWLPAAAALLAAALVTIAALAWLGAVRQGDSHHYFRERKPGTYASFLVLEAAAVVAALTARRSAGRPIARFWWITAGGFACLGLDDLLVVHERADRWIHAVLGLDPEHPVTDHLDDAIVAGYGLLALALAWRHRADLARLRWTVLTLGVAFATFALMAVIDWLHWSKTLEDALKLLAGTLILIGFLAARLGGAPVR